MDSNEITSAMNDAQVVETTDTSLAPTVEPVAAPRDESVETKEEIIESLEKRLQEGILVDRSELESLKYAFYKLLNAEREEGMVAHIENGGTAETFAPTPDESEARLKEVISTLKERKAHHLALVEEEKEVNFQKKSAILEQIRILSESTEDANKAYSEFKKLQQEWNEIKLVPADKANELWKSYQVYAEKFYDLIKLSNEFRDYDFKKNLEIKTHLCETAEKLAEEHDVISAFHQLQKLHQEFRDTGPVAKELREEIWTRFKAASTQVNRRHQQHFEELKEKEQHNLDEKTRICETLEATDYATLTTFQMWEDKTAAILALQAEWKTIGYAPQKLNTKIFERFRALCDDFFSKKTAFYKQAKERMNENLEKKKALCEKAESLKDSTEWKETADQLIKLQKEWKTIGAVPRKQSDAVWKRFISACDFFFEQKGKATTSHRTVEAENLEKKKALIAKLEEINQATEAIEGAGDTVRQLMKEFNGIGHVPFKEKDKIFKKYHGLIDQLFEKLNLSASKKRMDHFKSHIGKEGNIYREREKLVRLYESLKNDIQTYENNLGFLTSSSKKGNSLVTELNRKVEKLRNELALTLQKIELIDNSANS
ncbi:MAG: DUF349 domain-containing protein [Phocaeicola sp.]